MKCIKKVYNKYDSAYLAYRLLVSCDTPDESYWESVYNKAYQKFCDIYNECFQYLDGNKCDAIIIREGKFSIDMITRSVKHSEGGYQITNFSTFGGHLYPTCHVHTTIESIKYNELPESDSIYMVTF